MLGGKEIAILRIEYCCDDRGLHCARENSALWEENELREEIIILIAVMVVDFIIARCVMGTDLTRNIPQAIVSGAGLWRGKGGRKKEGDTEHDMREKAF